MTDKLTTDAMDPQDFDMAFAALAGDGGEPPKEPDKPAQPETPIEEPPLNQEDDEAAKLAAEAQAKADAEAAKAAEERSKREAEQAALEAKAKADAEEALKAEAAKAAEAAEKESGEAQKLLDDVARDFPEIAEALKVVRKQALAEAKNEFKAELDKLKKELAPVFSTTQHVAQSAHEKAILDKHPDAFDILDNAAKWVDSQPKFLQDVYNRVLDQGSAAEIVEFFDIYKAATGTAKVDEAAKKAEVEAEAERQRKLASQEGVRGRQTQKKETLDPNDFDGAFEKFAASA